jgi:hypothetical protein
VRTAKMGAVSYRPDRQNLRCFSLDMHAVFHYNEKLRNGAVAQLGERCVRNAQVGGSNPLCSIYGLRISKSGDSLIPLSWHPEK